MNTEFDRYVSENAPWIESTILNLVAEISDPEDSPEYAEALPRNIKTALTVCLQHALEREPDDGWSYGVADDIVVAILRRSNGPKLMDVYAAPLRSLSTIPVPEGWPSFGPSIHLDGGVISMDFGVPLIDFAPPE